MPLWGRRGETLSKQVRPNEQNTTCVFLRYVTLILTISLYLPGLTGCNNSESAQLLQDNPFSEQTKTQTTITILGCQGYVFELPDHIALAQLDHWPQPNTNDSAAINQNAQHLWTQNGLTIATAPLSTWPQLREQLIQSGAHSIYESLFLLRNANEMAEFDTAWLDKNTSFFVTDPENQLNGYSASPGTCFFRFNAAPMISAERKLQFRFNLVPFHRTQIKNSRMLYDEENGYKIYRNEQIIVFKELLLSGTIDTKSFIAISISDKNEVIGNLGRYFLMDRDQKGNAQRVLILVPMRIEAKRAASSVSREKPIEKQSE